VIYHRKVLRVIQNRDQDALQSRARRESESNKDGATEFQAAEEITTTWETFLECIFMLYKERPNSALQWCTDPDLGHFVRVAADVWTPRFLTAFLKMLSSLASGDQCASYYHEVLHTDVGSTLGNVSWFVFFKTVTTYLEKLSQPNSQYELSPPEISLIIAFLGLVEQVVSYSISAKIALCENPSMRALDTLFTFLVCKLPIELKSSVLETISAFCRVPSGGYDISQLVWEYLQRSQILAFVPKKNSFGKLSFRSYGKGDGVVSAGLTYDIREIEVMMQTYPETSAFLKLLKNLLLCYKEAGRSFGTDTLTATNRINFVNSYVVFVLEEIYLKLEERPFIDPEEKLGIASVCLEIFHLCISDFDVTAAVSFIAETRPEIPTPANANNSQPAVLEPKPLTPLEILRSHPGFELMTQILLGSKFTNRLFTQITQSFENSGRKKILDDILLTILKIFYVIIQNQKPLLEVIIPTMAELKATDENSIFSSLTGLDFLLASKNDVILNFFSAVNSDNGLICLVSLRIIECLSKSAVFDISGSFDRFGTNNRLVGIIDSSNRSRQILQGFADRIDAEGVENDSEHEVENANGMDPCDCVHSIPHAIKLTILDVLRHSLKKRGYGLAHYLLGIEYGPNQSDGYSISHQSLFHVLVENIMEETMPEIYIRPRPIFREKCYHLIYALTTDPGTCREVLRYLRNEHDFFFKHLRSLTPVNDPDEINPDSGPIFTSKLYQCAWLLKIIALELHVTAASGQRSQSQKILSLLFSSAVLNDMSKTEQDMMDSNHKFTQPIIKIVDILHHMNFKESQLPALDLFGTPFSELNLGDFMTMDSRDSEIFDIPTLYWTMNSHFNYLLASNPMMSAGDKYSIEDTIRLIMESVTTKNRYQGIFYGRFHCAQSWLTLVRVCVKEYFDLLPFEVREKRIVEILANLLQHVNVGELSPSIGIVASQTVLALISRLKQDRETNLHTEFLGYDQSGSYHTFILQGIVDGVLTPGSSPAMRGNHYSSLIAFINLIRSPSRLEQKNQELTSDIHSAFQETASFIFRQSGRFWELICRDAIDGEIVWRTVAFSLLACLGGIMNWSFQVRSSYTTHPFLDFLSKRNFLGHYIRTIKDSDDLFLQKIIDHQIGFLKLIKNHKTMFDSDMKSKCRFYLPSQEAGADLNV
jgi:nuclear pore complex protein Nup205